jgi:hypothetical protein
MKLVFSSNVYILNLCLQMWKRNTYNKTRQRNLLQKTKVLCFINTVSSINYTNFSIEKKKKKFLFER